MEDWLQENYRALHEQGRSWEQIAADADRAGSLMVAAWARAQALKDHSTAPKRVTRKPRQTRG